MNLNGHEYTLKVDCTTAESSVGAAEGIIIQQKIEGQNLQGLKYGTANAEEVTLSFWFSSPKTGIHCASIYLSGVQLEVGSVATDFAHEDIGTTTLKCYRYYWQFSATNGANYAVAHNISTTACQTMFVPPAPLRSSGWSLETSGTATDYRIAVGGSTTTCSAVPAKHVSNTDIVAVTWTVASGLTSGGSSRPQDIGTVFLAVEDEL